MLRFEPTSACLALSWIALAFAPTRTWAATSSTAVAAATDAVPASLEEITVTAQRLNEARTGIQTQTGASTYTIDEAAIAADPGRR